MAQGFTYRRLQPDIKEATLIAKLLDDYAGAQIGELAKARDMAAIHELTGMQQRWADLVTWLADAESAEAEDARDQPANAAPPNETPRPSSRRNRGGDAANPDAT